MKYLEVIHKMLASLSVLLAEFSLAKIKNKLESKAFKDQAARTLHDQVLIISNWISSFNTNHINEDYL
jgi:hypothetical protein